jgi:hypothetical protein
MSSFMGRSVRPPAGVSALPAIDHLISLVLARRYNVIAVAVLLVADVLCGVLAPGEAGLIADNGV